MVTAVHSAPILFTAAIRRDQVESEQAPVHNSVSGTVRNAVQARIINGDVHFHDSQLRVPRQLPSPIAELINQYRVLAELSATLPGRQELAEPVIAIVRGPRGSGKSTVAQYWSHQQSGDFPSGQLYANLGAWSEQTRAPGEVLGDFLLALGMSAHEMPTDLAARQGMFRSLTHGGAFLILLEDVVSAAQVRSLLPGPGRSVVVVTGHGAFASLKSQAAELIDVQPLEHEMAELLLRSYAGDGIDDQPELVREVLEWCAGLPIAICVVGALLAEFPTLSLVELMAEISADDGELAGWPTGAEPTLWSLFDAVYRRLGTQAQRCYRAIGAFPGRSDISVDALGAAVELTGVPFRRALRELEMMRVVERPEPGRLVVLGLVRAHGDRLASQPDQAAVMARLIQWYLAGAVAAASVLMPQRVMRQHLFPDLTVDATHPALRDPEEWLEAERSALRDVVLLAHRRGDAPAVIRLCVALWSLYEPKKYVDDVLATHVPALRDARRVGHGSARALLMVQMSFVHLYSGQPELALVLAEGAVAQARAAGDRAVEATAVESAGVAALAVGFRDRAITLLELNLAMAREIDDDRRIALACLHLAKATDPARALGLLDEAMRVFQSLPVVEEWNVAKVLAGQGRALRAMGELATARLRLTDSLARFEKTGRVFDTAQVLDDLGDLAIRAGDQARATEHYRQALKLYEEHGFFVYAMLSQERLAALS